MNKYDVIIIGGGVSGLSCAITLGSAKLKIEELSNKNILVIDAGSSHLNMAELHNVAGIKEGTKGPELLKSMALKTLSYGITLQGDNVVSVSGNVGEFIVNTENQKFESSLIVFANGMQKIDVEGIGASVIGHIRAPRPGMVMIENTDGIISEGKYVTGCAAGATSMFSSAAGYGAQTATDIISLWLGKYTVIHDVLKKD